MIENKNNSKKAIIALSGGVDSAVSAYLLQKEGYELTAVFMRNWDNVLNNDVFGHKNNKNLKNGCHDLEDLEMVKEICKHLNLNLKIYNFVDEYWNDVFNSCLNDLKKGYTPNPDVLCNKKIKFGHLLRMLVKDFGSNIKIATGHYAKIIFENKQWYLQTAYDKHKDQTYFLSQLDQKQLSQILFPLHNYQKKDVRQIALELNLPVWNKPDSTGICFIGEREFKEFLHNYLNFEKGDIIDITNNEVIGQHDGLSFYTWGQRQGLGLNGFKEPYYVCAKNMHKNQLFVCPKSEEKKYLTFEQTKILNMHWINQALKNNTIVKLRFRHTGNLISAIITNQFDNVITFAHEPIKTTSPGQYVVVYDESATYCLGGGIYYDPINMEYKNEIL